MLPPASTEEDQSAAKIKLHIQAYTRATAQEVILGFGVAGEIVGAYCI